MLLLFAVLAPRSAQWKWPHGVAYPILEMLVAPLTGCIPFWHGHSELLVSSGSRLLFDVLAIHVVCPNRIAGIRLFGGVAILVAYPICSVHLFGVHIGKKRPDLTTFCTAFLFSEPCLLLWLVGGI
jgi:hypothetical protein